MGGVGGYTTRPQEQSMYRLSLRYSCHFGVILESQKSTEDGSASGTTIWFCMPYEVSYAGHVSALRASYWTKDLEEFPTQTREEDTLSKQELLECGVFAEGMRRSFELNRGHLNVVNEEVIW